MAAVANTMRSVARMNAKTGARSLSSMMPIVDEFPSTPEAIEFTPIAEGVKTSTLKNGVTVISQQTGKASATVGLSVAAGSRFEGPHASGSALLLKHMAFTATHARSDLKLARDLEAAGLTADAAAGRESILYTVAGSGDMSEGLAAIAESSLTPKLASWEVKEVAAGSVAAELATVSSDPSVLLSETLHEAAFGVDTPLGGAFYQAPKNVTSESLEAFMGANYTPAAMTVVGNGVSHAELVANAESLFGGLLSASADVPASPYVGGVSTLKADAAFTHVALAFPSTDAATGAVLKALLGMTTGDMSSSYSVSYSDAGLVGLMGATEPTAAGAMVESFVGAFKAAASVDEATFALAKTAAKTDAYLAMEDGLPLQVVDVDGVTSAKVKSAVAAMLKASPSLAAVGPSAAVPSYPALTGMLK